MANCLYRGTRTPDYHPFARPFGFWWLFGQLGFFSKSIEKSTSSNDAIGWSRSSQIGSQNDKKSMKIRSGDLPSSTFTLFSRTVILNDSTSILYCFSCRKAPGPTKNPIKMHPGTLWKHAWKSHGPLDAFHLKNVPLVLQNDTPNR